MNRTVAICQCGKQATIRKDTYAANVKRNGTYLCQHCACIKAGAEGKCSHTPEIRAAQSKRMWQDPEFRKKVTAANKASHTTAEYRAQQSARTTKLWDDPEYKEAVSDGVTAAMADPEVKANVAAGLRRVWQDQAYREAQLVNIRQRFTEEFRQRMSEATTQQFHSVEARLKLSQQIKDWWSENYDELILQAQSPERVAKISESLRRKWTDAAWRAMVSAANKLSVQRPEVRQKLREASRALWRDANYRELVTTACKAAMSDPAVRESIAIASRANWTDQQYRSKVTSAIRRYYQQPEVLAAFAARSRELWTDPEYRANIIAQICIFVRHPEFRRRAAIISKQLWENDEYRKKMEDAIQRPEAKAKRSASSRAKWLDQEYRDKMVQASRAAWQNPEFRERMAAARAAQLGRLSQPQAMLYQLLDDIGVPYYKEGPETHILKQCNPFDCVVPSQNLEQRKHIIIEVQSRWHLFPRQSAVDQGKFTLIEQYFPEYRMLYIWDYEFDVKDQVIAKLQHAIGLNATQVDFEFKELTLGDVSAETCRSFLDAYHYLRKGRGGKIHGAYHLGKLVACAVIGAPIRQTVPGQFQKTWDDVLELSRFCIHPCYQKKNFASWFVSRVLRKYPGKLIVAYSDTTAGHSGTMYKAAGFKEHHRVPADYWYLSPEQRVVHKRTLYGRAKSYHMIEAEFANTFGYIKVYGYEKICFIRQL